MATYRHQDSLTVQKSLCPPTTFLPHRSADRRTTLGFLILILHTEVWIPKVSRDFLVRTILSIDIVSPFLKASLADIDHVIVSLQNPLSLYPRSHWHKEHIACVHNLVDVQWDRYELSHDKKDLDKSIIHCTEAILLLPVSRDGPHLMNVFQLLFHLANSLLERCQEFTQPEDIKYAIEYLQYLRGLCVDSFNVPRIDITASLIWALATQVESDTGDGIRNIEEMLVLFHELLASNLLADFPDAFLHLNVAINAECCRGHVKSLDAVIECLL